ncbi:hypothetical protein GHT06_015206 [Daphnia sinensis]|uniref:DUF5641 domain-containing protein n=1 Tax=Daphnia sinensis TaxID=1820382 RepID=A0AAD5KQU5_9CRUS|nr:hypothetical protein GHT06_015206 [Daphnia sinensis]
MADRTRLIAQRGGHRSVATRLMDKITDIVDNPNLTRAQKIHELQRKVADFKTKLVTIEVLDTAIFTETDTTELEAEMDAADTNNQSIRDAIDNFEFQLKDLQNIEDAELAALAPPLPAAAAAAVITTTPSASALPKLDLPVFKGDVLLWSSFWDVFEAEVDAKGYSGATKFNFLVSKLEGEAKAALMGLTSSNDNYVKAKDLLRERYSQPKKIIAAHYKALINLPTAAATRISLLTYPIAKKATRSARGRALLEALGIMPNAYGELLVCLLTDKLAIDVRRNLTRQQGKADWSLDELRAAIKQEIEIMGDRNDQIRLTMKQVCPYCTGEHYPTNCTEIKGPDEHSKMKDYLTALRERHIVSGKKFELNAKVSDVVLVHNEGPRVDWKLAVIDKLIFSPDGEVTETCEVSPNTPHPSESTAPVPAKTPKRQAAITARKRIRNLVDE